MKESYFVIPDAEPLVYQEPSKQELEFMHEFHALCMKHGTYTTDDEWAPRCYFSELWSNGLSIEFEARAEGDSLEFWYVMAMEAAPFGKSIRDMFEQQVEEHVSYMSTTTWVYFSPIHTVYLIVSESGIRRVAILSRLYNSSGERVTYERVL